MGSYDIQSKHRFNKWWSETGNMTISRFSDKRVRLHGKANPYFFSRRFSPSYQPAPK